MYLNDVKLMGRVRDDATLKHLGNGGAILDFVLVTTESFKNHKGEPVARKEAHRVVAFNNTAENAAPEGLLPADTEVLVEGFLRSRESGGYSITEVIARRIQTQGPPEDSSSDVGRLSESYSATYASSI